MSIIKQDPVVSYWFVSYNILDKKTKSNGFGSCSLSIQGRTFRFFDAQQIINEKYPGNASTVILNYIEISKEVHDGN